MKKFLALIIVVVLFTSCNALYKDFTQQATYTDPQLIGGKWTIISQGQTFTNCTCQYWGTNDDTGVFITIDGKTIVVSGSCLVYQEENIMAEEEYTPEQLVEGIPFERIRRITGYLVGTIERFNDAKKAELNDRVKHSAIEDGINGRSSE
jgi:hypothetical protein